MVAEEARNSAPFFLIKEPLKKVSITDLTPLKPHDQDEVDQNEVRLKRRQLLFQLRHRGKNIAFAFDPFEDVSGLKDQL